MAYLDVFIADAVFWLVSESEYSSQLTDEEFADAVKDRAAYLAHLSAE
jgi:hypothetical protein